MSNPTSSNLLAASDGKLYVQFKGSDVKNYLKKAKKNPALTINEYAEQLARQRGEKNLDDYTEIIADLSPYQEGKIVKKVHINKLNVTLDKLSGALIYGLVYGGPSFTPINIQLPPHKAFLYDYAESNPNILRMIGYDELDADY